MKTSNITAAFSLSLNLVLLALVASGCASDKSDDSVLVAGAADVFTQGEDSAIPWLFFVSYTSISATWVGDETFADSFVEISMETDEINTQIMEFTTGNESYVGYRRFRLLPFCSEDVGETCVSRDSIESQTCLDSVGKFVSCDDESASFAAQVIFDNGLDMLLLGRLMNDIGAIIQQASQPEVTFSTDDGIQRDALSSRMVCYVSAALLVAALVSCAGIAVSGLPLVLQAATAAEAASELAWLLSNLGIGVGTVGALHFINDMQGCYDIILEDLKELVSEQ